MAKKISTNSMVVQFLSLWVVNAVILLVLSALVGANIVLGTANLSAPLASVISGLILTVVAFIVPMVIDKAGLTKTVGKNEYAWAGIYLATYFVAVWVVKRFAEVTGLGVSNLLYVLILAVVLTLGGWGVASKFDSHPNEKVHKIAADELTKELIGLF